MIERRKFPSLKFDSFRRLSSEEVWENGIERLLGSVLRNRGTNGLYAVPKYGSG